MLIRLFFTGLFVLSVSQITAQTNMLVFSGNNDVAISQVTYNVGGSILVQNSQASGSSNTSSSVNVTNISITDGTTNKNLNFYNLGNAKIQNNNFTSSTGNSSSNDGIGVYNSAAPNIIKIQQDGMTAYEAAVIKSATNTNLMNYLFYDGTISNLPGTGTADYDLLYRYGWEASDYLVVAERDGNTYFSLQALDVNGNVIAGSNTLTFNDGTNLTGTSNGSYGWRTGYHNSADDNPNQDMWFTAASVDKFFEGTSIVAADRVVYGYRIDNDGNADVKFFGASNDPFENNPTNPNVVPEPAAFALLTGLAALAFLGSRRSKR